MKDIVLAGDIGGTRARLALLGHKGRKILYQDVLESRRFETFSALLNEFLAAARNGARGSKLRPNATIAAATFGIAGPVVDQRVKATNLPWSIEAKKLRKAFGFGHVTLFNDLVVVGLGALAEPRRKLRSLQAGKPRQTGGNLAVIAAGTGLGEATFVWNGKTHIPLATEGSHVDFAPQNAVEFDLWKALTQEFGHVSYERVASGSTISAIYRFFVRNQGVRESKTAAALIAQAEDPNVAVVDLAEAGKSEAAMRAVDLWTRVYGAEAGNLALKSLATAGVFVCGGVSARLATILAEGLPARTRAANANEKAKRTRSPFLEAFSNKGRMRALLETVPIAVCTEPLVGLYGAAAHAAASCD